MKVSVKTLLRLFCYISLAICFMPAVDYYCPWYVTLIPAIAIIGLSLYLNQGVSSLITALLYITGLGLMTFWFIKRRDSVFTYFLNFYITFLPAFLAIQLNKVVKDDTFFRDYLRAALLFVVVTCITSMIGHSIYPMASRELASGTAIYDTEKYTRMNIGGYDFVYSLVLLIPIVLWQIHQEAGFRKIWYIATLVIMVLCVYSSQYTIALICTVIAFLVVWVQRRPKIGLIVCCILVLFLLINGLELLGKVFKWASENASGVYVKDRLLQVSQLLSGQRVNTDTSDERIQHYADQLEAFARSPIFGHNWASYNKDAVSGHSLILDMMGAGGLFGLSLLILLIRGLYRVSVPVLKKKTSRTVQAVWIMATVVAILNPVTFPMIATVAFSCCVCVGRVEQGTLQKG